MDRPLQRRLLLRSPPRRVELCEPVHHHIHVRLVVDAFGALVLQRLAALALRTNHGVLDQEAELGRRHAQVGRDVVALRARQPAAVDGEVVVEVSLCEEDLRK